MPVAANKSRFDNRARTCCLSPASGGSGIIVAACSARTPRPHSTGCERGTCRAPDCRCRGRTESRTPSPPWSRASRIPSKGRQRPALPRSDQVTDLVACRFGLLPWLARVDGARLAWADSLRRDCGRGGRPDARGRDARARQPVDPVVGSISLALTDGGTYWTLVPAVTLPAPCRTCSTPWWPSSRSASGAVISTAGETTGRSG